LIEVACPCDNGWKNGWKNAGQYRSCVARVTGDLVAQKRITEADKDAIVSESARNGCGVKPPKLLRA
jgi:hypothetical protein